MKKAILLFFVCAVALFAAKNASNLPVSREASLVEQYSSSEVSLKATGFGKKPENAREDLKKAAIWFTLYNGTDPLLNSEQAKTAFEAIQESFFGSASNYITFEATSTISSIKAKVNGVQGFKVTKNVRVNQAAIRTELENKGVLLSKDALSSKVGGLPFLMVIPETPQGQTPLDVFNTNPLARQAAGVIESYLTAKKYDVVVPRAAEQLNDLASIQAELKGADTDISYQLSLALGADVYITFSGSVENNKATVVVKAFETTTARLLGTETGYSQPRPGASAQALVEEAINPAIAAVLSRITSYWQDDIKRGSQYKIIFNVVGSFAGRQLQDMQFAVSEAIEDMFSSFKENIVTDQTMDFVVWAKNEEYSRASSIHRDLAKRLSDVTNVTRINLNRKLIILGLDNP
ncbi:MAG: DUF6175 family protein [Chitinivibrionia bacterium]|nr:DUF6175 family protein [Chitinivibrionia bacterium]